MCSVFASQEGCDNYCTLFDEQSLSPCRINSTPTTELSIDQFSNVKSIQYLGI